MSESTYSEGSQEGDWLTPSEALSLQDPAPEVRQKESPREEVSARYGFRVGKLGLMVAQKTPSEVLGAHPIYPIPNTPAWFSGLVNLRGDLVPVFDLRALLDMPAGEGEQRRLLVLDKGPAAAGILVDGFPQALRLTEPLARMPLLHPLLEEHVTEVFMEGDDVWLGIDHHTLFHALGQLLRASQTGGATAEGGAPAHSYGQDQEATER